MRILIVSQFYPPEMGGAAARLHGLARCLVHLGHQVTVITGFPNYPTGVVPSDYRGKLRLREVMDGVHVLRTWVYASAYRSSVRRLANYFSFVASSAVMGLAAGRRFDVVVASSPPPFVGLPALALARLWRVPFVFDIRDIWPDVAVEAGELAEDSVMARLGGRLARFLYKNADHVTPVTESKRAKLVAAGVPERKLTVIANGVDLDQVPPAVDDKRAELGLEGKFVVLYAGLIGVAQGVEIVAGAADRLREHESIRFVIVGDGRRREALAGQIRDLGLTNVTLLPRQPREEMPSLLATADVCLVPLVNDRVEDAVPSKMLEAWGHGRPVILAAAGEAAAIVEQAGGGIVIPPGDSAGLAEAVLRMASTQEDLAGYARQGYACIRERFDRRMLAQQMEGVLQMVIRSRALKAKRGA
ncbi:MAG TPA: glycosyltransferase family 4 protein [Anaerolineae bacterium]|nr:glycosyltransferase family 4 protein [Anaerolineae bacterium]HOQ98413.1 glycosyltransferase family 4 protein [Anaerolineae bacterium]HPL26475.1 glycosyltransferase family 4 protein [Anaerolineae bacterium]